MKAYAITAATKTTGEIIEIEGQIHDLNDEIFVVKKDGELNRYYREPIVQDVFPVGEIGKLDGYWLKSREDAVSAAKHMIQNEIKEHSFQIRLLRSVRFQ